MAENLYAVAVSGVAAGELLPSSSCPVCSRGQGRELYLVDRGRWRVLHCGRCGSGWLFPAPTPAEVRSLYPQEYYGESGAKFEGPIELFVRVVAARQARFLAQGLRAGASVLDVGCGRGVLLSALADRQLQVHGFEISAAAIQGADPRAQIVVADDILHAGFQADSFDEVIFWHVLEHLANPRQVIAEVRRILKPGGRLIVAVPNFSSWQSRWSGACWFHLDLPRHLIHFSRSGLLALLRETDFEVHSEHHFSLRQNPFGWIQSWLNQLGCWPRNQLYSRLQRQGANARGASLSGASQRLLAAVLLPAAVVLSLLEAAFRQGGTFHVVATLKRAAAAEPATTKPAH